MKIKKEHQGIIMWGIALVAVMIFLIHSGLIIPQKFSIYDSDFVMERDGVFDAALGNPSINGDTIQVTYSGFDYTLYSGEGLYYISDVPSCDISPLAIYKTIPTPVGTNRICKVQYDLINDNSEIQISTYSTIYTKEVETQNVTVYQNVTVNQTVYQNVSVPVYQNVTSKQLCEAIGGEYSNVTCTCPNGDTWFDNSTSKTCGPITLTNTETQQVQIQQTFFQKYGLALIILIGAIVIILYMRGGKR